ncbi:copper resistance protein CopZ [Clostridium thermosuccinogenes]|uniref:Copper resistance protein CopZ n=2 Tax=Clostridium thermosuccinogenes TaxID=84032 RepID=A0A2K2F8V6_9CLOT|nr:heavy metal-associated domain-containing protein [Pseudoclostridium thermosuccinogenes]AUS97395.1 copper resistance protein CopZ [Pseudoclostridium thermosuccinogenes]PNT95229.1 copper resistance protein CopZ [Pseudoclostridium thermosuccinogenes]PNT96141.1 copper resistance protein CopZ [Pseudoclostridium thermosuccinogenes]
MKSRRIKLKQENMLCHRCVMNVIRTLSQLPGIEELNVDLDTKRIEIKYSGKGISKEMVENIVEQSIINGKIYRLPMAN